MKYLAIDYGVKKVGIAGSNSGIFVKPLEVVGGGVEEVLKVIEKYRPSVLVVGLPFSADGKERSAAKQMKKIVAELRKRNPKKITIKVVNEAYSTKEARRRHRNYKGDVDHFAAQIILEQFFNADKKVKI